MLLVCVCDVITGGAALEVALGVAHRVAGRLERGRRHGGSRVTSAARLLHIEVRCNGKTAPRQETHPPKTKKTGRLLHMDL